MGRSFGITALIFGLISIPFCGAFSALGSLTSLYSQLFGTTDLIGLVLMIGWLIPSIAVIFGIIGIIKDTTKGLAIAGLTLGAIALILGLLIRFLFISVFTGFIP